MARILAALIAYAPPVFVMLMALRKDPKPRARYQPVFRIQLDLMNVTIHPGIDLTTVRELPEPTSVKYFIDDLEVDQETFDRELERER